MKKNNNNNKVNQEVQILERVNKFFEIQKDIIKFLISHLIPSNYSDNISY